MKKIFTLAVLAILGVGSASAEDIIWQEDWTGAANGAVPSAINSNYSEVGGGTKVYATGTAYAGGELPELLIAKNSGSFTAKIALNGKNGEMVLTFLANYPDRIEVSAENATLGDKTVSGGSTSIPVIVASGTTEISLTFTNTNSSNVRFDNAKLYQGTAKKAAGLSWGTGARTVTMGADDNNFPTLTNGNNLDVTYDSSNKEVATIASDGTITLIAAGTTDISASFAGNDEYEEQTVTYILTVKAAIDDNAKGQKNNPWLITDEDFLTLVNGLNTNAKPKSDQLYVKGYITNIDEVETVTYGNATFKIAATQGDYNAEMKLKAYHCNYLEKAKFTAENQIKVDDEVVICGQIQWYNSEPQLAQGCYIYSLNGVTTGISSVKAAAEFNGAIYNIAGQKVSASYKGLVIKNGKKIVQK